MKVCNIDPRHFGASPELVDYRSHIVIDPQVRFGKPPLRGTRITVGDVLGYLAGGMTEDEILAEFPQLTREGIRACLAFAAERERISASAMVERAPTNPA